LCAALRKSNAYRYKSRKQVEPTGQVKVMSRIIVVPDSAEPQLEGCPVLMDEEVQPEHVQDNHSAHQLIERLAWAVCDADELNHHPTHPGGRAARGHR
jgi:hypothetical protein